MTNTFCRHENLKSGWPACYSAHQFAWQNAAMGPCWGPVLHQTLPLAVFPLVHFSCLLVSSTSSEGPPNQIRCHQCQAVTPTHSHPHPWQSLPPTPLAVTPTHSHSHPQSLPPTVTPTHTPGSAWQCLAVTPTHSHSHPLPHAWQSLPLTRMSRLTLQATCTSIGDDHVKDCLSH